MLVEVITYGLCAALVGVVYAYVLPDEPTPLGFWYDLLAIGAALPVVKWIAYPLGYCAKCTSGHIALWFWFVQHGFTWDQCPPSIVAACIAILSAPKIITFYEWKQPQ